MNPLHHQDLEEFLLLLRDLQGMVVAGALMEQLTMEGIEAMVMLLDHLGERSSSSMGVGGRGVAGGVMSGMVGGMVGGRESRDAGRGSGREIESGKGIGIETGGGTGTGRVVAGTRGRSMEGMIMGSGRAAADIERMTMIGVGRSAADTMKKMSELVCHYVG